jgi:flagellar hook-associated protein 1 FlgK
VISGLNVGLSGLFAAQRALDVTAHNIANVNTPGYSRQRVEQSAATPTTGAVPMLGPGAYGRGVTITGVRQLRDALIDARILDAGGEQGAADVAVDATNAAQAVVGTLDEGLGTDLSAFWSAWDELSRQPSQLATREAVLDAGRQLSGTLRAATAALDGIAADAGAQLTSNIAAANDLADRIADLNASIQAVVAQGGQPNDLYDQRSAAVNELARLVGATTRPAQGGTIDVVVGGGMLVSGTSSARLSVSGTPPTIAWSDTGTAADVAGAAGALERLAGTGLGDVRGQLDAIASGLRDAVNALHTAGYDLQGAAGAAFFTGTGAADFEVNAALAAGGIAASASGAAADGNQAVTIAALRTQPIVAAGSGATSATDAVANLVADVGRRATAATRAASTAGATLDALEQRRSETSGVSIDEELTNLLRFQRAYEAAARVITTADQMLDTLVNRVGIVGR